MTTDKRDWYKTAFDGEYSQIYAHRTDQSAQQEINWIISKIDQDHQTQVLDLCCGNGRHTTELQQHGLQVTGFDLSAPLLKQAYDRKNRTTENYVRGDMRHLPFRDAQFSLIVSLFTSFGYFQTDEENLAVLKELARTLSSKGQVFLDFLNAPLVRATLIPQSNETKNGQHLLQERSITKDGKRVEKKVTYARKNEPTKIYYESVRLFTFDELSSMFEQAHLTISGTYGSLEGNPYTHQSSRLVLQAHK